MLCTCMHNVTTGTSVLAPCDPFQPPTFGIALLVICFLLGQKRGPGQAIELQGLSLNQWADCPRRRQLQDYTQ